MPEPIIHQILDALRPHEAVLEEWERLMLHRLTHQRMPLDFAQRTTLLRLAMTYLDTDLVQRLRARQYGPRQYLSKEQAQVGVRVEHLNSHRYATITATAWPDVWIVYDSEGAPRERRILARAFRLLTPEEESS